jgi:CPA1 family monovalent cation:H+ antiporter
MEDLHQLEIIIVLFVAVLALTTVAHKLLIPYPILLVIGGLLLALVPELPRVHLDPDLVFLVFLPPILWSAAYFTSLREFRANLRPIGLLAIGLVVVTTAAVAFVVHAAVPGMGWAAAVTLGAIVSPPDAIAATAIARRLQLPGRLVTILEGESLVNDATALVLYRAAVAAVVTGRFVLGETLLEFFTAAAIGIAVGMVVSKAIQYVLRVMEDSFTEIGATLLAPYIAWMVAEQMEGSGVLACVAGGILHRRYFSVVSPMTRIQARAVWDLVVFLLNGVIFILIGLQLSFLRDAVPPERLGSLIVVGVIVSGTVIAVRLFCVPAVACVVRWVNPRLRARDPLPPWRYLFIVGWTGMRGIVTLAAALALPHTTADGAPFPFRSEIILLSFGLILVTLVLQGLSLAPLIQWLNLKAGQADDKEEQVARERAAVAALARLDELEDESWPIAAHVNEMRAHYGRQVQRYAVEGNGDADWTPESADALRRLRHEALTAERHAVILLRNDGIISDEVLHRLEHELDVEALRHGLGKQRLTAARHRSGHTRQ